MDGTPQNQPPERGAAWYRRLIEVRAALFSTPSRAYPLGFFVVVLLCLSYYFFKEVPDQQSAILKSDFSALAAGSDQLKSVLQTYVGQLSAEIERRREPAHSTEISKLNKVAGGIFTACKDPAGDEGSETVLRIKALTESPKISIRMQDVSRRVSDSPPCIEAPLEGAVERVIARHVDRFDGIALALSDGVVIYQKAQGGFRLMNVGSLLQEAFQPKWPGQPGSSGKSAWPSGQGDREDTATPAPADWREVSYTALLQAQFEGEPYKVMVQPIPMPVELSPPGAKQKTVGNLLLIGVLSESRLTSEARRIYLPRLAPLMVVLCLALLALWPVLKLWKMAPADGFRALELVFLVMSLLAAVSLVTVVVLYSRSRGETITIDKRLNELASLIDTHLAQELSRALKVLESATGAVVEEKGKYKTREHILTDADALKSLQNYQWLDQIAWSDQQGQQYAKWSVLDTATAKSSLSSFDFFPALQADNLWKLRAGPPEPGNPRFLLAPIPSFNTGKHTPLILQRISVPSGYRLAMLSSYLVSVTNPILSTNYGFAIIDARGDIKFHSEPSRNLVGNLLRKIRGSSQQLRDSMDTGEIRFFDVEYLDRPVRMRTGTLKSIQGSPWTLVTWHNLDLRDNFLLRVFSLASVFVVIYGAYLISLAVATGIATFRGHLLSQLTGQLRRVLETVEQIPNLWLITACFALFTAVDAVVMKTGSNWLIWVAIVVTPLLLLGSAWFLVRAGSRSAGQQKDLAPASSAAVLAAVACGAFALACLPAVGFTRICWDFCRIPYVMSLETQQYRALSARRAEVKLELQNIPSTDKTKFVEARLNEKLDRYDSLEFRRSEPLADSVPHHQLSEACDQEHDLFTCWLVSLWRRHVAKQVPLDAQSARWQVLNTGKKDDVFGGERQMLKLTRGDSDGQETIVRDLPPYPCRWWPDIALAFIPAMLLIVGTTAATFFYRFQWHHKSPAQLPNVSPAAPGQNRIVVSYPSLSPAPLPQLFPGARRHSLGELLQMSEWNFQDGGELVITEFEKGLDSLDSGLRTLDAVERLVGFEGLTVTLVSAVDPASWWEEVLAPVCQGAHHPASLRRCAEVFSSFRLERDCRPLTGHWGARECYLAWRWCTPREKLVLRQLSETGLPNPKNNRQLDRLIQRGLITPRRGSFEIANPQFAGIVASSLCGVELSILFPPGAESAWRGLRQVVLYGLILTFVIILISLIDLWGSPLVRIFTFGGAALPLIKTAYDIFSRDKKSISA